MHTGTCAHQVFHLTSKEAAKRLGITTSLLMRVCRLHGTTRWPYRKMASLETLRQAITIDGNISEEERKVRTRCRPTI